MDDTDAALLFGKYQLCRILGTGRFGTVFLTVHTELCEYRAVKRVPKSSLDYEHFRREAFILKELRHPGIPIVYDIEEDESYSYLIEEYLEGESLFDLVKRQGHLSRELCLCYGLSLSRIVSYLHSAGKDPILHLDLQPKNLLLCSDRVKLIDFGQADYARDASKGRKRYGTIGCAAPEQRSAGHELNERTDIYAVGAILHFLLTGAFPSLPYEPPAFLDKAFGDVIKACLKEDPKDRIRTAGELEKKLESLSFAEKSGLTPLSSLTIAWISTNPGAGATHGAIGLSVYLKFHGFPNLYEENNDSGMGAALGEAVHAACDGFGIMRFGSFVWKPCYGEAVRLKNHPYELRIVDYGHDVCRAAAEQADGFVLVLDGRIWNRRLAEQVSETLLQAVGGKAPVVAVYNHRQGSSEEKRKSKNKRQTPLKMPYFDDPFRIGSEAARFYGELLGRLAEAGLFSFEKSLDSSALYGVCGDELSVHELRKGLIRMAAWRNKAYGRRRSCSFAPKVQKHKRVMTGILKSMRGIVKGMKGVVKNMKGMAKCRSKYASRTGLSGREDNR